MSGAARDVDPPTRPHSRLYTAHVWCCPWRGPTDPFTQPTVHGSCLVLPVTWTHRPVHTADCTRIMSGAARDVDPPTRPHSRLYTDHVWCCPWCGPTDPSHSRLYTAHVWCCPWRGPTDPFTQPTVHGSCLVLPVTWTHRPVHTADCTRLMSGAARDVDPPTRSHSRLYTDHVWCCLWRGPTDPSTQPTVHGSCLVLPVMWTHRPVHTADCTRIMSGAACDVDPPTRPHSRLYTDHVWCCLWRGPTNPSTQPTVHGSCLVLPVTWTHRPVHTADWTRLMSGAARDVNPPTRSHSRLYTAHVWCCLWREPTDPSTQSTVHGSCLVLPVTWTHRPVHTADCTRLMSGGTREWTHRPAHTADCTRLMSGAARDVDPPTRSHSRLYTDHVWCCLWREPTDPSTQSTVHGSCLVLPVTWTHRPVHTADCTRLMSGGTRDVDPPTRPHSRLYTAHVWCYPWREPTDPSTQPTEHGLCLVLPVTAPHRPVHTADCTRLMSGAARDVDPPTRPHSRLYTAHVWCCPWCGPTDPFTQPTVHGSRLVLPVTWTHRPVHTADCARLMSGAACDVDPPTRPHSRLYTAHVWCCPWREPTDPFTQPTVHGSCLVLPVMWTHRPVHSADCTRLMSGAARDVDPPTRPHSRLYTAHVWCCPWREPTDPSTQPTVHGSCLVLPVTWTHRPVHTADCTRLMSGAARDVDPPTRPHSRLYTAHVWCCLWRGPTDPSTQPTVHGSCLVLPVTWTHRPVHTADCTRLMSGAARDVDPPTRPHSRLYTAHVWCCPWRGPTDPFTQPTVHGSCLVLPVMWTHRPVHSADCTRLMSGAARDVDPPTRPHSRLYTAHVWCCPWRGPTDPSTQPTVHGSCLVLPVTWTHRPVHTADCTRLMSGAARDVDPPTRPHSRLYTAHVWCCPWCGPTDPSTQPTVHGWCLVLPVTWTHWPVHTADCTRLMSGAACDVDPPTRSHSRLYTAHVWCCLWRGPTDPFTQPTVHGSCLVLPVTWTHRPVHTADCTRLMSGAARDVDPPTRPHSRLYTAHVWCCPWCGPTDPSTQPTVHGSCLVLPVTWTHRPVHTADCTRLMSGATRDVDPPTRSHSRLYTAHVWCCPWRGPTDPFTQPTVHGSCLVLPVTAPHRPVHTADCTRLMSGAARDVDPPTRPHSRLYTAYVWCCPWRGPTDPSTQPTVHGSCLVLPVTWTHRPVHTADCIRLMCGAALDVDPPTRPHSRLYTDHVWCCLWRGPTDPSTQPTVHGSCLVLPVTAPHRPVHTADCTRLMSGGTRDVDPPTRPHSRLYTAHVWCCPSRRPTDPSTQPTVYGSCLVLPVTATHRATVDVKPMNWRCRYRWRRAAGRCLPCERHHGGADDIRTRARSAPGVRYVRAVEYHRRRRWCAELLSSIWSSLRAMSAMEEN